MIEYNIINIKTGIERGHKYCVVHLYIVFDKFYSVDSISAGSLKVILFPLVNAFIYNALSIMCALIYMVPSASPESQQGGG